MALLTEKQIEEVVYIFLQNRDTNAVVIKTAMEKWNEKQATQQFELDWEKTSSNATKVYLDAVWFNDEMKEIDRTTICGWDRPVTPHPHAALMMKYAEVAARRVNPWVEFEGRCESKNWTKCCGFNGFHPDFEYRHIGDDK